MPSFYSSNLKLELIQNGEQAGTWGTTTNTNLGTLLDQAIAGFASQAITDGADTVITIPDGATGVARNMAIKCTGALTANRNLIVPSNTKLYFIDNATTGGYAVTVKVSGQTGVSVPNGKKMVLVSNGTDVVSAVNYFATLEVASAVLSDVTSFTASGTATFSGTVSIDASDAITAAATTDLSTVTSVQVVVSGTTTITSFGTSPSGTIKVLKFSSATPITYNATSMILPGGANMVLGVGDILAVVSKGSGNWEFLWYTPNAVIQSTIQAQTYTAYTTGGTSTAYTLTPTPAITANSARQRFNITFHTAPGASPTLAVSGQTALSLKYYDSTGAKQFVTASVTPSGWVTDIINDGTDWVVQQILFVVPIDNSINDFRLTLTTGVPVTTTDVTGATTVYCTPYKGNRIALYDGSATWNVRTTAEFSLALGALTSGKPYDVFCYDNAGTPTLEFLAWTNDTTRATALVYQDGVLVKSGATTRRYLGTFYTTAATTTEDSKANRYLWNYYNRVQRKMYRAETATTWVYTLATWRQANANTSNQLNLLIGVSEDAVTVECHGASVSNTNNVDRLTGIGLDSTSAVATDSPIGWFNGYASISMGSAVASYNSPIAAGRHYLVWLERSEATGVTTWYGTFTSAIVSAIFGTVLG